MLLRIPIKLKSSIGQIRPAIYGSVVKIQDIQKMSVTEMRCLDVWLVIHLKIIENEKLRDKLIGSIDKRYNERDSRRMQ